jgi:uncharacterized protein (TIGR03437 family)
VQVGALKSKTSAEPLRLADETTRIRVNEAYGRLPLSFELNRGQAQANVKFLSMGGTYSILLSPNEVALNLSSAELRGGDETGGSAADAGQVYLTVRLKFIGANPSPQIEGLDELPGKSNYLIGNDPKLWHTSVPNYAKVRYREVYPGVDLIFYGNQHRLEYDFVVNPGADPNSIKLSFDGVKRLRIDRHGDLILEMPAGEVRQQKPAIYQEVDGERRSVAGHYEIRDRRVGFKVASYDRSRPLVIDPVLEYSVAGVGGIAISVDPANPSTLYATRFGSLYRSANGGSSWSIVVSFDFEPLIINLSFDSSNPMTIYAGTGLGLQKSVNGGATWERISPRDYFITAMAIDRNNPQTIYIGAGAVSSGGLFKSSDGGATWRPASVANRVYSIVIDPANSSRVYAGAGSRASQDAFVIKLNPDGSQVVYSQVFDGGSADLATSIAVNPATGAAFITGHTASENFPITSGAYQPAIRGANDFFVMKLNADGSIAYSTFLGGSGNEMRPSDTNPGPRIAIDASDQAYVSGTTSSSDFPVKQALQPVIGGGEDAVIAKLDAAERGEASLVYSTYLGDRGNDAGQDIAVNTQGEAFVLLAGTGGLPATGNWISDNTLYFGYLAKLNAAGNGLVYANYLGVPATSLAIDRTGNVYVAGWEIGVNVPSTPRAIRKSPGNGFGTYMMKVDAAATSLVYSTFMVGERAFGIAVGPADNAYVTGLSYSFIPTTPGAARYQNVPWFTTRVSANDRAITLASVSAASFAGQPLARNSLAAAFGLGLSDDTRASVPLPDARIGTKLVIKDSAGIERNSPLLLVSPLQINYQIPAETATGPATLSAIFSDERFIGTTSLFSRVRIALGTIEIANVAPGVFAANANGRGVAAAVVQRVRQNGTQDYEMIARFDQSLGQWVSIPVDLGPESDQVFLALFGTGWRFRSSEASVKVTVGGIDAPVVYAGMQPTLVGVDQINVRLPRTLSGRGEVDVVVTVDGKTANTVRVSVK